MACIKEIIKGVHNGRLDVLLWDKNVCSLPLPQYNEYIMSRLKWNLQNSKQLYLLLNGKPNWIWESNIFEHINLPISNLLQYGCHIEAISVTVAAW